MCCSVRWIRELQPAAKFLSAASLSKALSYAASRPNALGGTGLLYPFKSGVFRGLMKLSEAASETAPAAALVTSTVHAVGTAGMAAYKWDVALNVSRLQLLYLARKMANGKKRLIRHPPAE
jgi:hypothetical protein